MDDGGTRRPGHGAGDQIGDELSAWAASGAMALTGRVDGPPLGPPSGLVGGLRRLGDELTRRSRQVGAAVVVDPLALLGERAAAMGLHRQGTTSCGGSARLLATADGWLALNLARPDDIDLVPAWLELDDAPDDVWAAVAEAVAARPGDPLVGRAAALGLPAAVLPRHPAPPVHGPAPFEGLPVRAQAYGPGRPVRAADAGPWRVVDLSSLWAGPLAGHLLGLAGAEVVKVESVQRPDGARRGPAPFFDLLNAAKASVVVDLDRRDDVDALRRLLADADVVIEASRPRALEQLGIVADELLRAERAPTAWISITGHGRSVASGLRVAFGDDAAVAGGLVCSDADGPVFCADAVADPITGLVAAAAALAALTSGDRWMLDVAMADVAASLAGPTVDAAGFRGPVAAPAIRRAVAVAPPMGHATRAVLGAVAEAP